MSPLRVAVPFLFACLGSGSADGEQCAGASCEQEDEALLQLQARGPKGRLAGLPANAPKEVTGAKHVRCTYSDTMCSGNQCCPRALETDEKTYPCPSATVGWNGCEGVTAGSQEQPGDASAADAGMEADVDSSEAGGEMPWRAWESVFPGKTLADFRRVCDGLDDKARGQCYQNEFSKADPSFGTRSVDDSGMSREDYKRGLAKAIEWYPGPDGNRMIKDFAIIAELSFRGVIPSEDEPMADVSTASMAPSREIVLFDAGLATEGNHGNYKHAIDAEVTPNFIKQESTILNISFVELPGLPLTGCSEGQGQGDCGGSLGPFHFQCIQETNVTFQAEINAKDGNSDSFFIDVSGSDIKSGEWNTSFRANTDWFWSRTSPVFRVAPGAQTVMLRGREDGIGIRTLKIVDGSATGTIENPFCFFTHGFVLGQGDDNKCTSPDGRNGVDCFSCPGERRTCSDGFTGVWQRYVDYEPCELSKYTCIEVPAGDDTRCTSPGLGGRRDCEACPAEDQTCSDKYTREFQYLMEPNQYCQPYRTKYTCVDKGPPGSDCVIDIVKVIWKAIGILVTVVGLPKAWPGKAAATELLTSTYSADLSWIDELNSIFNATNVPKKVDQLGKLLEHLYNRGVTRGFLSALYNNSRWAWIYTVVRIVATLLTWVLTKGALFAAKLVTLAVDVYDFGNATRDYYVKCR